MKFKLWLENDFNAFVQVIMQNRYDSSQKLIPADWLEEQGQGLYSDLMRLAYSLSQAGTVGPGSQQRDQLWDRYQTLFDQAHRDLKQQGVEFDGQNNTITFNKASYRLQPTGVFRWTKQNTATKQVDLNKMPEAFSKAVWALLAHRVAYSGGPEGNQPEAVQDFEDAMTEFNRQASRINPAYTGHSRPAPAAVKRLVNAATQVIHVAQQGFSGQDKERDFGDYLWRALHHLREFRNRLILYRIMPEELDPMIVKMIQTIESAMDHS